MKPQPTGNDFAAFIGIDWADAKYDICLQAAHAARRESSALAHRPDLDSPPQGVSYAPFDCVLDWLVATQSGHSRLLKAAV